MQTEIIPKSIFHDCTGSGKASLPALKGQRHCEEVFRLSINFSKIQTQTISKKEELQNKVSSSKVSTLTVVPVVTVMTVVTKEVTWFAVLAEKNQKGQHYKQVNNTLVKPSSSFLAKKIK